jgi:hypothetical protein
MDAIRRTITQGGIFYYYESNFYDNKANWVRISKSDYKSIYDQYQNIGMFKHFDDQGEIIYMELPCRNKVSFSKESFDNSDYELLERAKQYSTGHGCFSVAFFIISSAVLIYSII